MQRAEFDLGEMLPVILEVLQSGGEFRLYPKGSSMLPTLREGKDSVLLTAPVELARFDMCLYRRRSGQLVLHRLMSDPKGELIFCGDNQLTMERGITRDDVLAVVRGFYRREKRVDVTARTYRLYVRLYCLMPLRRAYLFCRRALGKLRRMFKVKQ